MRQTARIVASCGGLALMLGLVLLPGGAQRSKGEAPAGPSAGAGALVGAVARQGDGRFLFKRLGSPADDPGLTFQR
jgi:hypothetical protein